MSIHKLRPAVNKHWLFVLAGVMWTAVGIMLLWRAYGWFAAMERVWMVSLGVVGIGLGFMTYRFGFIHTVRKNIQRLQQLPERVCLFAFNSWKGYIIVGVMIALGITLRSSPIPRPYLAVFYTMMGGSLFLASFHFYTQLWQLAYQERSC